MSDNSNFSDPTSSSDFIISRMRRNSSGSSDSTRNSPDVSSSRVLESDNATSLDLSSGDIGLELRGLKTIDSTFTLSEGEFSSSVAHSANISTVSNDDTSIVSAILVPPCVYNTETLELRCCLAKHHMKTPPFCCAYPIEFKKPYIGCFHKGLYHDEACYVDKREMRKLIHTISQGNNDVISLNMSDLSYCDFIGPAVNTCRFSPPKPFQTRRFVYEMLGVYAMSLVRDIPFSRYIQDKHINDFCMIFKTMHHACSPFNIFRGPTYGDSQGPYISQFFYRDVRLGGFSVRQKYPTYISCNDHMLTWTDVRDVQNRSEEKAVLTQRESPRYIINGRDLASIVHKNSSSTIFLNVLHILLDLDIAHSCDLSFCDEEEIGSVMAMIGRQALAAANYIKWKCLYPRPEMAALEVERVYKERRNRYGISLELLQNDILVLAQEKNGTSLLSQVYPEGSPLYPSTPCAHAAVASACATVLKFYFDGTQEMYIYEPDMNGDRIINTGKLATLNDELNKMVHNIGMGRCWAGVNYRMDVIKGIKLGEKVALSCLRDIVKKYTNSVDVNIHQMNDRIMKMSNI